MRDLEVYLRDLKIAKYSKERAGLRADTEIIAIKAIERATEAEAENAKYKRALELACMTLSAEIDKQYCPADAIDFDLGCDYCDNCHDQDESVCWVDFYIMQAQKEEDRSADCDI